MRFLMLVCRDESIEFSSQDRGTIGPRVQAWVSEMEQRGVRLLRDVLAAVDATVTVSDARRRGRCRARSARTDERARFGLYLLECADIDEAIEVSAKHPIAEFGLIELRPIVET